MFDKRFIINDENVNRYVLKIGDWIKKHIEAANANGVVLGMSGGVDCSTVAALCSKNGIKVNLILMPYGNDWKNTKNYHDAMELINKLKLDYHIFDIKPAVDNLEIKDLENSNQEICNLAKANIRPRIRMTYLYQYAQINNLLVIGTGNLSERTVGYFTKWGDGANDLNPLGMLTKKEVYILAKHLGVPDSIINKKPSADLWEGQTDEEELGIKYSDIDEYILNGTCGNSKIDEAIELKHKRILHKLNQIPIFNEE